MKKKASVREGVGQVPETIEEQEEYAIAINYSCHMHPITQLAMPDFMDRDKSSLIDTTCGILYAMLPMVLNFFLNVAPSLINIILVGQYNGSQAFAQICLGTAVVNILVYGLVEYMGAGFAIICSYFSDKEKAEVGYLYQKTLGISFCICVMMTPVIYLSDKVLRVLTYDHTLVANACTYAWGLVPSFYLYAFLDTNKNYLQSQGVIFPPILIHLGASLFHFSFSWYAVAYLGKGALGAAWARNISDALCCAAIYTYIVMKQPTQESWVEWSLKSTNNIGRFIRQVIFHEAFTYFEVIAFQLLGIVACLLPVSQISAHFSFAMIYMLLYFVFNSLSQCLNKSIAGSIQENEIRLCKKKISLGLLLTVLTAFLIVINIVQHRQHFTEIFVIDPAVTEEMSDLMTVFGIIVFASGLNITLTGIAKTLELHQIWKYSFGYFFIGGIGLSSLLCYGYGHGVWGIWVGWLVCILASLILHLQRILCLDFEDTFSQMRDRYKMLKSEIRLSRIELSEYPRE